jgi:hypothetical protein
MPAPPTAPATSADHRHALVQTGSLVEPFLSPSSAGNCWYAKSTSPPCSHCFCPARYRPHVTDVTLTDG